MKFKIGQVVALPIDLPKKDLDWKYHVITGSAIQTYKDGNTVERYCTGGKLMTATRIKNNFDDCWFVWQLRKLTAREAGRV